MQERSSISYLIQQVRKCNRKLSTSTFLVQAMRRGTLLSVLKNRVPATPAPHGGA